MADIVNVGNNPDDGMGDKLRDAFIKINDAFNNVSGLEAIDEGNGIGWRLKGRNPDNYGDIGLGAIDLGASDSPSTTVGARGDYSAVGGGFENEASSYGSNVGGGYLNKVSETCSSVGGGAGNEASGKYSTIGGGRQNKASDLESTVGGGRYNEANGTYSTVSGGVQNEALDHSSTVGGGFENKALSVSSTIGGGYKNEASGPRSSVGGGIQNKASGNYSTVGGGMYNEAGGAYSTVSGGIQNIAKTFGEFLGGLWATIKEGSSTSWIGTDRIFGIGNGTSNSNRSDALNVYKNGVAELPSVTNELIDTAGDKTIVTKEWVKNQINLTPSSSIIIEITPIGEVLETGDVEYTFTSPYDFNLTNYWISAQVAPIGSGITVRLKVNGTYIDSTGTTIPTEIYNSLTSLPTITTPTIVKGDRITAEITDVGSTYEGEGLTLYLES